jgi:hypothetical protein
MLQGRTERSRKAARGSLGGSALGQKLGDIRVAALLSESQRGLSVVRLGVNIGAILEQHIYDTEVSVRCRRQQWRVSGAVSVIWIGSVLEEPGNDGGMPAGHRSR